MQVLTDLFRKVGNYDELIDLTNSDKAKWFDIHDKIILSKSEYNYFLNNLLEDYSFFRDNENNLFIVTDGEDQLFVDTQGYDYARYVGLVLGAR